MGNGVVIEKGAQNWQVFQQNKAGAAKIELSGSYTVKSISPEPPFVFVEEQGQAEIFARIVIEGSGQPLADWQPCNVLQENRWSISFESVVAGGLYRIETRMEYVGCNGYSFTRGDMRHHIGVGDVFVVAGQSNACGRSKQPVEDAPELGVHMLQANGCWGLATHPLGDATDSIFAGHSESHNPGHSPFLHFAKIVHKQLGHPVGIVMTAHGGTPLSWWVPSENGALAENMLEIIRKINTVPKAVLWYQGEAEAYDKAMGRGYMQRFASFVQHIREGVGTANLAIFAVQLNRCLNDESLELDRAWGRVRQAQVDAMMHMEGVYTVPANDLPLCDCVHISSQGNMLLAERLAQAVLCELHGKKHAWLAPCARRAVRKSDDTVEIFFENVQNKLDAFLVPAMWLPIEAEDAGGIVAAQSYTLNHDSIVVTFVRKLAGELVLHGMWRMNPGVAGLQDIDRGPVFSFYGLRVEDECIGPAITQKEG